MVADLMTGRHHFERVAVRVGVISHTAVTGPVVFAHLGKQLVRRQSAQQRTAGGEKCGIHEITAGDIVIHTQRGIVRLLPGLVGHSVVDLIVGISSLST